MGEQQLLAQWAYDPRDCWATPQIVFDGINKQGQFDVDACADVNNFKLERYWSFGELSGLQQDWRDLRVWCNPPFSQIDAWITKAFSAKLACLLVPMRTDCEWWHRAIKPVAGIDFFRGRISFIPPQGVKESSTSEKHCLLWFRREGLCNGHPLVRSRDSKTGLIL